jgi:hypothetical protein
MKRINLSRTNSMAPRRMQIQEAKHRAAEHSSIPYLSAAPPQLNPTLLARTAELNSLFFSLLPLLPGILMK